MSTNAEIRDNEIKELEKQSKTYRARYHITEDFFCEYDPSQDYVLGFTANGKSVFPTCQPVGIGGTDAKGAVLPQSKDQFVAQRLQTIGQLSEVISRVDKFKVILDDYKKMDNTKQKSLYGYLEAEDKDIGVHMETMVDVVRAIHTDLTQCKQTLYSEHDNALLELKPAVCEPLGPILINIEKAIYPRMISIERTFAAARSKLNYNAAVSYFKWSKDLVISALSYVFQQLKSLLITIGNFIFLHSKPAIDAFARHVGNGLTYVKDVLCGTVTPGMLPRFYVLLDTIIHSAIDKSTKFRTMIRNKLRTFCNKSQQKLIPYLATTVKNVELPQSDADFDKWVVTLNDDEKKKARDAFHTFKLLQDAQVSNSFFCQGVRFFSDDQLTNDRLAKLLWMICVTSMELLSQYFVGMYGAVLGEICSKPDAFIQPEQPIENPEEYSLSVEDNDKATQDSDVNVEMENIPRIEEPLTDVIQKEDDPLWYQLLKNSLKKGGELSVKATIAVAKIAAHNTKKAVRTAVKPAIDATTYITGNVPAVASKIIQVLFDFFWFFAEHNYLPVKEIENNIAADYGPKITSKAEEAKEYAKWMGETWDKFENPDVVHTIPDYVRYAFCKAQGNSPEECLDLVNFNAPLTALADSELRYENFVKNEKAKYEVQDEDQKDALLQEPEDVDKTINNILAQVGEKDTKLHNNQLESFQRIVASGQKPIFAVQPQVPNSTPVAPRPAAATRPAVATFKPAVATFKPAPATSKPSTLTLAPKPAIRLAPSKPAPSKPALKPIGLAKR